MKENNAKGMSKKVWIIAIVVIAIFAIIAISSGNSTQKSNSPSNITSNVNNEQKDDDIVNVSNEYNLNEEQVTDEDVVNSQIQVGDYVEYQADTSNSYNFQSSTTGIPSSEGINLTATDTTKWRVWEKKADGTIVLISKYPQNNFSMMGLTGFVNSTDIIENMCDLYANSKYGVTSDDVRSLKIEDLEEVSTNLSTIRNNYSDYGKTNSEINSDSGYTNGIFYTESDGVTIKKNGIAASIANPMVLKQTYYSADNLMWKSLDNEKFPSETYGTLLGTSDSWLASPCANLTSDGSDFYVQYANSNNVKAYFFGNSNHYSSLEVSSCYCRPLVTLKVENLTIASGDGSEDAPWTFEI